MSIKVEFSQYFHILWLKVIIHSLVKTLGISMHHLIHMVELLSLTKVLKENAKQS